MIRISDASIDAILKDSQQCVAPGMGDVQLMVSEIRHLKAEVNALRKDAERWRFVRNPVGTGSPFAIWSERTNLFLGKFADEAIDAAMTKEQG